MDSIWELIFQGGPLGIAATIVGFVCSLLALVGLFHSLIGKSRGWTLGWAATALAGGLVVGLLAWIQAGLDRALIHLAVSDGWAADVSMLALRGHYEVMQAVELRLWVLLLPLGLGTFMLVRGLMLPGSPVPVAGSDEAPGVADTVPAGRGPLVATIGCLTVGSGLGLWAVADLNHFGAYIMALMMGL